MKPMKCHLTFFHTILFQQLIGGLLSFILFSCDREEGCKAKAGGNATNTAGEPLSGTFCSFFCCLHTVLLSQRKT